MRTSSRASTTRRASPSIRSSCSSSGAISSSTISAPSRAASRSAVRSRSGSASVSSTATTTGPVTRCAFGPTMTSAGRAGDLRRAAASACTPLPPVNGSASATTFHGPVSAQAIDSARSGSSRTTRQRSGTSALRASASTCRRAPCAARCRSRIMPSRDSGAALRARQRDLAREAVGGAVEQLLVLDEQALELGPEGARDAHRRLHAPWCSDAPSSAAARPGRDPRRSVRRARS